MLDTTGQTPPPLAPASLAKPAVDGKPPLDGPRTRGVMIFGMIVMFGFFGGFMAWAVFAPLSEAAIAPGMIKVEGTRRTLQHLEGGMVREILVRDGDVVREGQVVMRLDDIAWADFVLGEISEQQQRAQAAVDQPGQRRGPSGR